MTDDKAEKKIDDKKTVKNKVVINPKLSEVKDMGGELEVEENFSMQTFMREVVVTEIEEAKLEETEHVDRRWIHFKCCKSTSKK